MARSRALTTLKAVAAGAAGGNTLLKLMAGLGAAILAFAPPTARTGGAENGYDFQYCTGNFALCAASTCTPTGNQITISTATGGAAAYPEADCTCPIFSSQHALANLAGGNMQGSCQPPGPGRLWSLYVHTTIIPQAITNWVPTDPEAAAPMLNCPASLNLGNQFVNCFSVACDSLTYINNVPVATCHCPIGVSNTGTPVAPHTWFFSQAGQGDQAFCAGYPVGGTASDIALP